MRSVNKANCLAISAALAVAAAPLAHAAAAPTEWPLYPDSTKLDGPQQPELNFVWGGEPRTRNVSRPTLTIFAADPVRNTGTAVIVAPGGGFQFLSMKSEGEDVARWLAARIASAKPPLNLQSLRHSLRECLPANAPWIR